MTQSISERTFAIATLAAAFWLIIDVYRISRPVEAAGMTPASREPKLPDQPWTRLDRSKFDLIVEHSLFTPGRRADFRSVGGRDSTVAGFVLRGLVAAPTATLALFESIGRDRTVAVRPGEQLAGRRVLKVSSEGVTIDDNGVERRLTVATEEPVQDQLDRAAPVVAPMPWAAATKASPSVTAASDPIGDASGDPEG